VTAYGGPPDRLVLYERLVLATPGVERKGATIPYTSRNGHMFSFLDATGSIALRLPPEARDEFLARYDSRLAEQHGHTMKEYAATPPMRSCSPSRTPGTGRPRHGSGD
jgi:hypothetical protein